ncbi:hypothetical protein QBC35DRAFT_457606 [Podospora australis]|uniref:Uncharacterized protein n=1 Tax=Podospora australis TaxID=1536484 RepID=A0AAN6WIP7_9PEZI|nr:hypothetical protein QBC35DRAFT_457606 [Podospora australis]
MKFSITPIILTAFSSIAVATPVAAPEIPTTTFDGVTPTPESHLAKRAGGTLKVWRQADPGGCLGNPYWTYTNPASWTCQQLTGPPQGYPLTFQRLQWSGQTCTIRLYSRTGCDPAYLVSTATTSGLCWSGGWQITSWSLSC